MIVTSQEAEDQAILNLAYAVCAAARTAPKACGIDHLDTAVITGDDKTRLAEEMRQIGSRFGEGGAFFIRDADTVDISGAVVLIGARYKTRGLNEKCGLCGFENCAACAVARATCIYVPLDLGIALGSAVSLVADNRVDNRIMFTIGKAAASLGLLGNYKMVMGIPLIALGKSPFFDRK